MAVHKLIFDDFITVDYGLVAIHSSLEDYRLAYFLNRELELKLERNKGVSCKTPQGESCFSRYTYTDDGTECTWNLLQNKNSVAGNNVATASLFQESGLSLATNVFLMPELKRVDYILKIENTPDQNTLDKAVQKLLSVKYIATAYKADLYKLKYKNNLIF